jgi:ABC-2 type transport system permease protein
MAADTTLQPVTARGWQLGFANLLSRENHLWWGTRRWWIQAVGWMVALNGLVAFALFVLPGIMAAAGEEMVDDPVIVGLQMFFGLGSLGLAIGAVILTHDQIVEEKNSGTAAWVLSKPASRAAFVLAKVVANAVGMFVLLILLQSAVAYVLLRLVDPTFPLGSFALGAAILALHLFFYLVLTLTVGVFASTTGTVLAISLGVLLGGALLSSFIGPVALATPWLLGDVAVAIAAGDVIPPMLWIPVAGTALLSVLLIVGAILGFARQEL